ncbi:hypothetical protein ROJ8625_04114 [Roseivivax jejudonensis]|uniref:Uncharacterized protein n=1 Tax=Roseivivax jejudonensis TaxID=1529041 RepID=A0A1X7AAZ5_9RHOB|nr:hypothetical protein [Roseivivax jejudonensis]SLN74860.1 hypothetical protein ROJ8625_04114 [Roseivivax jejudonensis]
MARKLYDLAVKTDTYRDNQGNEKARWQNIGAVMSGDDGKQFLLLDRWFNPAGLPNPDNRSNVIVSCFEPKGQQQGQNNGQQSGSHPASNDIDTDSIPF